MTTGKNGNKRDISHISSPSNSFISSQIAEAAEAAPKDNEHPGI